MKATTVHLDTKPLVGVGQVQPRDAAGAIENPDLTPGKRQAGVFQEAVEARLHWAFRRRKTAQPLSHKTTKGIHAPAPAALSFNSAGKLP